VSVGFARVEGVRVLVPVLVTNGGGGKLLDRSFRVLEH